MALSQPMKVRAIHFLPLALVLILFVFYGNFEISWSMANKIAALVGLALAAITFLLGPLARFWPNLFAKYISHRKYLGLFAFAFIVVHVALSIVFYYDLSLDKMLYENPKVLGFYAASVAFIIFFVMSVTSTQKACGMLGYRTWKMVQMCGYIALVLSLAHFYILETKGEKGFSVRPLGYAVFALGLLALAAKVIAVLRHRAKTAYEQHVQHEAAHAHAVSGKEGVLKAAEEEGGGKYCPPGSGFG
ncbi:MAG: hypothetical protein A3C15_03505 [Candidatus Magasanikbacteria bacterium RIFCSPHIGHO2_02_FULL_50_9b]|uniref:Ferric oxidoreductase domain-containing protein n=1 Tax=Candidatus Magasanikbacteria bacterium RIFCSPHIGHO2_02_FULL_50_9b TaxID=1798682 RepID=A0A1F6M9B8_9BACT|nr:MAG: hypothetical protein A3C15_03505 [Candidatus Magasanikbacteria bacterium RIFCSPHIGHO2_02_FULL_50_9b]